MDSNAPLAIPDSVQKANQSFLHARDELAAPILANQGGLATARSLRKITDSWLVTLWTEALPPRFHDHISLHATGGYGRDELALHSDIDVLIALHDPAIADDPLLALTIERLMAWTRQTRLRLSHVVRTAEQARQAVDDDPRSAIALLDLRPLMGPPPPDDFSADFVVSHLRADDQGRTFVAALLQGHRRRVRRQGQTVFLLEPDLKIGEGGLRDLHYLAWAAAVRHQINLANKTHPHIGWSYELHRDYQEHLDALLSLRNQLHLLRGRKQDRLTFREQEALATISWASNRNLPPDELLHLAHQSADDDGLRQILDPIIETMMSDHYRRARRISTTCERFLRRWSATDHPPSKRKGPFVIRGQLLSLADDSTLSDHHVFDALLLAGESDLLLDPRLETAIEDLVDTWPRGDDTPRPLANRLRDLLVDPAAPWRTSHRLLELGILQRILPEFEPIVCHVQHNLYHVYTTDIHSLKCLEAARNLLQPHPSKAPERWPFFAHVASRIEERTSFLLAALFHDIGKNRGGDHSLRGAQLMAHIGPRLGLSPETLRRLTFLVRHHLDLSTTSRRRDISDPAIISELAERIADLECLNQLTALTYCDMSTVAPEIMNDWNASLLMELYANLHDAITLGLTNETAAPDHHLQDRRREFLNALALRSDLSPQFADDFLTDLPTDHILDCPLDALLRQYETFSLAMKAPDALAVTTTPLPERGVTELVISAPDQPGTLARIAGAIASRGVNIMSADIVTSAQNQTVDIFHIAHFNPAAVPPANPRPVDDERRLAQIRQTVRDALSGHLDINSTLKRRRQERRLQPRHLPRVATDIRLANDASDLSTVIEVRAPDRLGLLHAIASTFLEHHVNTRVARIDSLGSQAIDTFYIEDAQGNPLSPARIQQVIDALHLTLSDQHP